MSKKHPSAVPEMLAYMLIIIRVAQEFEDPACMDLVQSMTDMMRVVKTMHTAVEISLTCKTKQEMLV